MRLVDAMVVKASWPGDLVPTERVLELSIPQSGSEVWTVYHQRKSRTMARGLREAAPARNGKPLSRFQI